MKLKAYIKISGVIAKINILLLICFIFCKQKTIEITKGDIVNIDVLQKHRIKNVSEHDDLVFIEVQLGTYFGEDDIVRISDDYKRN